MVQPGIQLECAGSHHFDPPQFLFYPTAEQCAQTLGMKICTDLSCQRHDQKLGPHSHTDDLPFGGAQGYPEDDVERAGLRFRQCTLHGGEVTIVWHFWTKRSDPPVVYYVKADIVIPTARGGK